MGLDWSDPYKTQTPEEYFKKCLDNMLRVLNQPDPPKRYIVGPSTYEFLKKHESELVDLGYLLKGDIRNVEEK